MDLVDPDQFNLADYVLEAGRTTPSKIALTMFGHDQSEKWTFAQLEAAILGTATGLLSQGLEPGDRVLLRLGNEVLFPIAFLGAIAADLIPVPTAIGLTPGELRNVATKVAPKLILQGEGVSTLSDIQNIGSDQLRAFWDGPATQPCLGQMDRPGYLIMTSGTTAGPKVVTHAHRAILGRRFMRDGWYGLGPDDRMAHAGAFNWTYTLGTGLMDPWSVGATALIPKPGITPRELPVFLKKHEATIFAAAPGVYRQMLKETRRLDLPSIRHGLTAGEKCPESLRNDWHKATGTDLHEAFGQSEISTFISGSPQRPAPVGTIGFPQNGRRICLLDDLGKIVDEPDIPGIIAIHRDDPGLMLGLWDAEAQSATLMSQEWYATGDMASFGADGSLTYLGRNDDLLNSGGFRVSPLEVEAALEAHSDIGEVAAVDLLVRQDVSVICAFYTGRAALNETDLTAHAQGRLAPHKRPRKYVYVDKLPRNPNGKLLRMSLAQAYGWPHDKT